jgi:hypothetical protein
LDYITKPLRVKPRSYEENPLRKAGKEKKLNAETAKTQRKKSSKESRRKNLQRIFSSMVIWY